ncbi:MAG: hypothetical protein JRI36_09235 [Deltaproteobacteria bacterium]|nr:hypothetical protein [Deltaproteobacteria bacterium]
MTRYRISSQALAKRLDCFGNFDPHDPVCLKWCQLSIRCAIAKNQYDQVEIMEDFFDTVLETSRPH